MKQIRDRDSEIENMIREVFVMRSGPEGIGTCRGGRFGPIGGRPCGSPRWTRQGRRGAGRRGPFPAPPRSLSSLAPLCFRLLLDERFGQEERGGRERGLFFLFFSFLGKLLG